MYKSIVATLLVLLPAAVFASFPACASSVFGTGAGGNQALIDAVIFAGQQEASCAALCASAMCVNNVGDLTPLRPCLNISSSLPSKIKKIDLSKLKNGACVIVTVPVSADLQFGSGNDCLNVTTGGTVNNVDLGAGDDYAGIQKFAHVKTLIGGDGNDVFQTFNQTTIDKIIGGAGADIVNITGNTTIELIDLGAGSDFLIANATNAFVKKVLGGDGSDVIYFGVKARAGTIDSGNDDDIVGVAANASVNVVKLGSGSDILAVSNTFPLINREIVDQSDSICGLT